ncbi:Serine/threonine protein kinase [Chitinispirillum alkaliphilum]|nr:Serine/threonine protein kinase [Chitinispirillum alkaliphilum]
MENLNSIITGIDSKCHITFFNRFSEKLFGFSRSEVLGRPFLGTIVPLTDSSRNDNSSLFSELFTHPEMFYETETEGVTREGKRVWFTWSAQALYGDDGALIEILIVGNDITGRKDAEKKVQENLAEIRAMNGKLEEKIFGGMRKPQRTLLCSPGNVYGQSLLLGRHI